MTSTLKTELKASPGHEGFCQSGTLKISSVEDCEKSFEMGGHLPGSGMAKSVLKAAGIEVYNGGSWSGLRSKLV